MIAINDRGRSVTCSLVTCRQFNRNCFSFKVVIQAIFTTVKRIFIQLLSKSKPKASEYKKPIYKFRLTVHAHVQILCIHQMELDKRHYCNNLPKLYRLQRLV